MKSLYQTIIVFFLSAISVARAQTNLLTYAGNSGSEIFNDVLQLSNGQVLVIGAADNLDWINASVPKTVLPATGITNNMSTGKYCFLLVLDSTLQNMQYVYYLPQGAAEDLRYIKTTNLLGQPTGSIYISGNTTGSGTTGGYFIGRLNNNFVSGNPTGFAWVYNVYAKDGSYPKTYQPWDVGSDGKVVYAYGDSHDYNWAAVYRLKTDGTQDVVPNWRVHTTTGNQQFLGSANSYPGGISGIAFSAIVFKRDGGRCELRSPNAADYNTWLPDGNGGSKRGKWPLDVLFSSACVPGGSNPTSGPGYTGYGPSSIFTFGPSSVCIDKRNNHIYIGFNAKSVLPGGNPDFEPAVMAMDETGTLKWWSRLYHEVTPAGDTVNSSPDQYIDALAVDYSKPAATGYLVVGARCHGNNTENFWEGNTIAANPGANGFQNRFTGSSGNIHLSWLGKLTLQSGTLMNSTYMGELAEGATGLGSPSSDPIMDSWPSPNSGFPTLNTTYLGKNNIKVTADGSVLVLGNGRRTITTANAHQKMIKPADGKSAWNHFVRLYDPALSGLKYSSLVAGAWDAATGNGGDNVRLYGVFKTAKGIIAVGQHTGSGGEMPVTNVPAWGSSSYNGTSAVLAYYQSTNMLTQSDNPYVSPTILPVNGWAFTGKTVQRLHRLYWETAGENNNSDFYVQKSTDGSNYTSLAFIPVKTTNGTRPQQYNFTDVQTAPGSSWYRLLQTDKNGRQTASGTVLLQLLAASVPSLYLYPNPVADKLHLLLNDPTGNQMVSIEVYDAVGRRLLLLNRKTASGSNTIELNIDPLPTGSYQVRISNGAGTPLVQHFMKGGK